MPEFLDGVERGVEIGDIQKLGETVDDDDDADDADEPVEMRDVNRTFTKCIIQSMMHSDLFIFEREKRT